VPEKVFKDLLEVESKGRFMRNNIIDCYETWKINRPGFRW
jgi:hypothetical protein